MGWFRKPEKYWAKLPIEYLDDWLGNDIVLSQDGKVVEFESGRMLRLEFEGGGYWGPHEWTPDPTTMQWWFRERTDSATREREVVYQTWQKMAREQSS